MHTSHSEYCVQERNLLLVVIYENELLIHYRREVK